MREEGLTRLIGITAIGDTAACRRVIASGRFNSAQVYYNILNPSAGQDMPPAWQGRDFRGLIATCNEHGVAVDEHPRARSRGARDGAAPWA